MTREELKVFFHSAPLVRGQPEVKFGPDGKATEFKDKYLGKGLFECDLISNGFTKKELRKLVEEKKIFKVTTTFKGGWRNTYVLPMAHEEMELPNK